MFSDALGAQKFNALQTHVPDYFRRMVFAVVGGDRTVPDGAGAGQERPRVALVGRVPMQIGVFLVKEVHVLCFY